MNRHTTFLELAAVGIDFRLTPAEQARLDGHLTGCPACRTSVAGLHADAAAIAGLPEARLDPRRAAIVLDAALHGPARSPAPVLRLALVAALVGALAIGAALVGAEILRRMTENDISVVPPVPTASPGPEASAGVDNGVGTTWVRVELPDAEAPEPGGATMTGVIAGGPGAIAWGWAYGLEPRIWTAPDGRTWERATVEMPGDAAPDYRNPGTINDIVAGGPGYVAVGFYYRQGIGHTGLVWTSPDGRTWDLVPDQPDLEHAIIYAVLPWRGELLAFGHWSAGPSGGATEAIAWTSRDGRDWTRLDLVLPDRLTMGVVVAAGNRLWSTPEELGDDTGMEWTETLLTSTDGRTWTLSDLPHQTGSLTKASGEVVSLVRPWPADSDTSIPPEARRSGVYRSPDGVTWQALSTDPAIVGYDLVEVGSTLVMVGDDSAGDPECWADCQAMGWRSLDGGVTWEAVPAGVIGGTMTSIAVMPDGTLVAVGRLLDDRGSPSAAAWVSIRGTAPTASQLPSPAASPPSSPTPTPQPTRDGELGLGWVRVELPGAEVPDEGGAMDGVIAGGPGAIAWGQAYAEPSRIWTTTDGLTWERASVEVPDDARPDADIRAFIAGISAGGPGYIAVGAIDALDGRRGLVWTSIDGRTWTLSPDDPDLRTAWVASVLRRDGGLLAYGIRSYGPDGGEGEQLAWTSADGRSWDPAELVVPEGLRLGPVEEIGGRLWAWGHPADGPGLYEWGQWRWLASDDGLNWQITALPYLGDPMFPTAAGPMTLVPPRWVADDAGLPDPGVYLVTDDMTWRAVSVDGAPWGSKLVEVGSTLIVVGDDSDVDRQCPDDCHPIAWRSRDHGSTWQAVPVDDREGTIRDVVFLPDGTLIAVGMAFGSDPSNAPVVWISVPGTR